MNHDRATATIRLRTSAITSNLYAIRFAFAMGPPNPLFGRGQRIPARHLLRRINPIVTRVLADLREKLKPFYSEIGRPSTDPELNFSPYVWIWHEAEALRKFG